MKIKTAELTGAALNWVAGTCEGFVIKPNPHRFASAGAAGLIMQKPGAACWADFPDYSPSTDWAQGGPIIEREAINVVHPIGRWLAYTYECKAEEVGPTPLIAAMRCYVASKLGDSVDVPDELL